MEKLNSITYFRSEVDKKNSFSESFDLFFDIVSGLGFTQLVYARQIVKPKIDENNWIPLKLNVRNFPAGWDRNWEQFESHDPYYHACFYGTLPFDWEKVQNNDLLYTKEKDAWKYLADYGLLTGMTIPIHLPDGKFAVVSAIVDRRKINWTSFFEKNHDTMFYLTHLFNKALIDKGFINQVETADVRLLTPRETECLKWVACGKTSPEISVILQRSVDTVRLHIKNSMLKLNSNTRTHAVAKAVHLGILDTSGLSF